MLECDRFVTCVLEDRITGFVEALSYSEKRFTITIKIIFNNSQNANPDAGLTRCI